MRPNINQRSSFGFVIVAAALVIGGVVGLVCQRENTMSLRAELELLRLGSSESERLQVENKRLWEKQISASELEILRADHAALPRLREEMESLNKHP